jgi:aryl-alcohol dehydrogenase-like predicted oxidoreductase
MKYRKLGRTDIEVSVIAMGCGQFPLKTQEPDSRPPGESECVNLVHEAMNHGITLFDTAASYGRGESERLLGKALAGRRSQAIIATKAVSGHVKPEQVIDDCHASLRRLGTDYIDLYQIHWPNHETPVDQTLTAANQLLAQGKIRAFGVSNFGPGDLSDLLVHGRCESNQVAYNLLFRSIEFAEQAICVKNNIGILCYSPICQGLLSGKYRSAGDLPPTRTAWRHFSSLRHPGGHGESGCESQTFETIDRLRDICRRIDQPMSQVALAWCIHQPGVAAAITGARRPDQIALSASAADLALSDQILAELNDATNALKQRLGHNSDPGKPAGQRIR